MREFKLSNGWRGFMVESLSELPIVQADELYLDLETASTGWKGKDTFHKKDPGDPKRGGSWPYLGDRMCGIAVTWDDHPDAYYVPIRHTEGRNLDVDPVLRWLATTLASVKMWINHNIKFDAHFCLVEGVQVPCKLIDTLTLSKCIDSDRFKGHRLKGLCRDWCELEMSGELDVHSYLEAMQTKDFAEVPATMLGPYACEDVLGNRLLYKHIKEVWPASMHRLWDIEVQFTRTLLDIEHRGLRTDPNGLKKMLGEELTWLSNMEDSIDERVGFEYADSAQKNYKVYVEQLGLPVIEYTKPTENNPRGNPCFDKNVLPQYTVHPLVVIDPEKKQLVSDLAELRKRKHFKSLYLENFLFFGDSDSCVHPSYNQMVRTGRTSCSDPPFQLLNTSAKELVIPRKDHAFLSFDASQIEFRIIVHYTKDERAIEAYRKDARTDFHTWVANEGSIKRDPAKTLNFAMAYGAGKKSVTGRLRINPDIVGEISERVAEWVRSGRITKAQADGVFKREVTAHASHLYEKYHDTFPGIKRVSAEAQANCERRGYCFDESGRRRYLRRQDARKAFNSVVQGFAMIFIKTRMNAIHADAPLREAGVQQIANVHDEILFEAPIDIARDELIQARILHILQEDPFNLRVPLRWDGGYSEKHWAEASKGKDAKLDVLKLEAIYA